jgi:hypothetical protein
VKARAAARTRREQEHSERAEGEFARQRSAEGASSPSPGAGERPRSGAEAFAVAEFAEDAAVCGALGCRETRDLLVVERGGQQRVLCPPCAAGWWP